MVEMKVEVIVVRPIQTGLLEHILHEHLTGDGRSVALKKLRGAGLLAAFHGDDCITLDEGHILRNASLKGRPATQVYPVWAKGILCHQVAG